MLTCLGTCREGSREGSKWLHNPCLLGRPPTNGTKSKVASQPLPWGPHGGERSIWLRHPLPSWGPCSREGPTWLHHPRFLGTDGGEGSKWLGYAVGDGHALSGLDQDELAYPLHHMVPETTSRKQGSILSNATMIPQRTVVADVTLPYGHEVPPPVTLPAPPNPPPTRLEKPGAGDLVMVWGPKWL